MSSVLIFFTHNSNNCINISLTLGTVLVKPSATKLGVNLVIAEKSCSPRDCRHLCSRKTFVCAVNFILRVYNVIVFHIPIWSLSATLGFWWTNASLGIHCIHFWLWLCLIRCTWIQFPGFAPANTERQCSLPPIPASNNTSLRPNFLCRPRMPNAISD